MSPNGPDRSPTAARLSAATTVVGVVGDPVVHSLSPLLHNTAFAELGLDWVSVGFPVRDGSAAGAVAGARALGVRGLSVTMPHKETMARLADHLTPLATRLDAVNCLSIGHEAVIGDNTDGPGLVAALRRAQEFDPAGRRCLVVGGGGAARAVVAALADAGASEVVVVNRSAPRARAAASLAGAAGRVGGAAEAAGADLVVNATPLGMGPLGMGPPGMGPPGMDGSGGSWPVDPELLGPGQLVVDLVYHPPVTPWLEAARSRGARTANGLGMLVHQAALQLEWWTGRTAPLEAMWHSARAAQPA
jgi:shikimate dehydrogenase